MNNQFNQARIKDLLRSERYDVLRCEAAEQQDTVVIDAVNERHGLFRTTLLYEIVEASSELCSGEAVRTLIELGADPLICTINGNTPLHAAAANLCIENINDLTVVECLLHAKHVNNTCAQQPCYCGLQALEKQNNRLKLPKNITKITTDFQKYLIGEELLFYLETREDLKSVYDVISTNGKSAFSTNFPDKLMKRIIDLEDEHSLRHCVLPMMFLFWPEAFTEQKLKLALFPTKYNSFFMICALIELNNGDNFEYLQSWINIPYVPETKFLPIDQSLYQGDEMIIKIGEFVAEQKNLEYLIVAAASSVRGHDVINYLLKKYSEMIAVTSQELNWKGLNLKSLNIQDPLFKEISEQFSVLHLSHNQLIQCPTVYLQNVNCSWHKLVKLRLNGNKLKHIEKEIFQMQYLEVLDLADNELKNLPEAEFTISLRSLYLDNNELETLPDSMSSSMIYSLSLKNNNFENFPKCICYIPFLQVLSLDGNRIIDFPVEMGSMAPDIRISLKNMEIHHDDYMIESPKLLINHLRTKLHDHETNRVMCMMTIGPKGHGKTHILESVLKQELSRTETTEVQFGRSYKFRRPSSNLLPFSLRTVDFPGNIAFSTNQCFLTNRSLYLLVWDVSAAPNSGASVLNDWIDCLVSADVPDSLVMIIGNCINRKKVKGMTEEDFRQKLLDLANKNQNFRRIRFGVWQKEPGFGKHWFSYLNRPNDMKTLRRRIEEVACSLPLCHTRSPDVKFLGGPVPDFYLYLQDDEFEFERADVLTRDQVNQVMERRIIEKLDCCGAKSDSRLKERDFNDAIRFLKDTGYLLHFDDNNHNLNDLFFTNLNWLNSLLKQLSESTKSDGKISSLEIKKRLERYKLGNNVIHLIQRCNIGFIISKDGTIQLCNSKWLSIEDRSEDIRESFRECREKLCRLHVFNGRPVPFGFWLKLLSRLMIYADQLVMQANSFYAGYRRSFSPSFFTKKEITASEVCASNCIYDRHQFCYIGNKLLITVKQVQSSRSSRHYHHQGEWWYGWRELKGKAAIITEVTSTDIHISSYVFTTVIKHIETVLEEWHKNLLEANTDPLGISTLSRLSPCLCRGAEAPCQTFDMKDCFRQLQLCGFDADSTHFQCKRFPTLTVPIQRLFPDLLLLGFHNIVLPKCHSITNDKELGKGGNGIVYAGTITPCRQDVEEQLNVAIKVPSNNLTFEKFISFIKEAIMAYDLADHPFITTFFGIRYNLPVATADSGIKNVMAMLMEQAPHGSLTDDVLALNKHINPILCFRIAYQIADALNFMHSLNILHRDLKPDNVLLFSESLTENINVKLSDFGTACYASSQGLNQDDIGTIYYQPPELFNCKSSYTFSVDIYAYGMILHALLSLEKPFNNLRYLGFKNVMKSEQSFRKALKLENTRKDRICLQRLMERCTEYKVADRQMTGEGLVFVLRQPCFQLLMNSVTIFDGEQAKVNYMFTPDHATGINVFTSNNGHCTSRLLTFVEVVSEKEKFWDLQPQTRLDFTLANCDAQIVYLDRIDRCYSLIVKYHDGYHLVHCTIEGDVNQRDPSEMSVMPSGTHFTGVKDLKRVVRTEQYLYLYFEDAEGMMQLHRMEWPMEVTNSLMVDDEPLPLLPWNVLDDMSSTVDVCIHDDYKLIALDDMVILLTNDFDDQGVTETDRYHVHKIEKIFLFHPYIMVKHASCELTFLKILNIIAEGDEMFTFDHDYKKTCKLCGLYSFTKIGDITASCFIFDKVWLGTSCGYIFILTLPCERNGLTDIKVKRLQPYKSAVEYFLPFDIQLATSIPEFVVSYGKSLNTGAFHDGDIHPAYPTSLKPFDLDRHFLGKSTSNGRRHKLDSSDDLLLLWHATGKQPEDEYDNGGTSSDILVANAKLEAIKEHRDDCNR